jgi:hypothetical protein
MLDSVINLQEQMATIMAKKIKPRDAVYKPYVALRDRCREGLHQKDEFITQGGVENQWPHWKHLSQLCKQRNAAYQKLEQCSISIEEYGTAWDEWRTLNNECQMITKSHPQLWPMYFDLEKSEINEYFTIGDPEDIDNQEWLKAGSEGVLEGLSETHSLEQLEYEKPFKENPFLPHNWWDRRKEYQLQGSGRVVFQKKGEVDNPSF